MSFLLRSGSGSESESDSGTGNSDDSRRSRHSASGGEKSRGSRSGSGSSDDEHGSKRGPKSDQPPTAMDTDSQDSTTRRRVGRPKKETINEIKEVLFLISIGNCRITFFLCNFFLFQF